MLFNYARGIDEREVEVEHVRKSIGTQLSWGVRFQTDDQLKSFLLDLAKEVSNRLKAESIKGKKMTLYVFLFFSSLLAPIIHSSIHPFIHSGQKKS